MQALLIFPLLPIEGEHQNDLWPALTVRSAPNGMPLRIYGYIRRPLSLR